MKAIIVVLSVFILSGCGIIHNSIHPYKEHCMYNCYSEALRHRNENSFECIDRDTLLGMRLLECDKKCDN